MFKTCVGRDCVGENVLDLLICAGNKASHGHIDKTRMVSFAEVASLPLVVFTDKEGFDSA